MFCLVKYYTEKHSGYKFLDKALYIGDLLGNVFDNTTYKEMEREYWFGEKVMQWLERFQAFHGKALKPEGPPEMSSTESRELVLFISSLTGV